MARDVNPPRGMRDFLPADKARRERALAIIRSVYRAHGFDEIETPVVEDFERLHSGLGGDNEKLGFSVLKRGLTHDDLTAAAAHGDAHALADLGLRFDLTVPLARFYASHRAELPTVFRAIQIAPVWRAERPQKGRYRQFHQIDAEIIGAAEPTADVELLVMADQLLKELGVSEGVTLTLNTLGDGESRGPFGDQFFKMVAMAAQLGLSLLEAGDVEAVADDIAARRAVFDNQQMAAVIKCLFEQAAIRCLMDFDPFGHPFVDASDGFLVLAALSSPADDFLEGIAGSDQVAAGLVDIQLVVANTKTKPVVRKSGLEPGGRKSCQA